jgi:peptide/nickel transport system substrate-binding protein
LETNVYVDRWFAADFDSALSENGSQADPHLTYSRYFISGGNFETIGGLTSPELDELFAAGLAETDPEARVPTYAEISRVLLEESPWVWLYQAYRYQVLSPDVEGFVPNPAGPLASLREVTLASG